MNGNGRIRSVYAFGSTTVVVSFKAPVDLVEVIDIVARRRGMSRSELIRKAIEYYLSAKENGKCYATRRIRVIC